MAKYSRSALSMKESLREISQQKAEKFLNTFYFQYGHRSIADLAHIALAIERLSILAAIAVADEQRWDGQERSTRYQDFKKSGYYVPDFGDDRWWRATRPPRCPRRISIDTVDSLFAEYEALSDRMFLYLASITPKPDEMKQDAYERTLRARAFDISRYLLPLAANTSLGEIVNARTLENQVSHLLSHTHKEIRRAGRAAETGGDLPRVQREPGLAAGVGRADSRRFARVGRARRAGIAARSPRGPDAGEVCRSQPVRDRDPARAAAGGFRTDGRFARCPGPDWSICWKKSRSRSNWRLR